MSFESYFWNKNQIEDSETKKCLEILTDSKKNDEEKKQAFTLLLSKNDAQSLGIAFDHYFYANSTTRFGTENIFEVFKDAVLKKARLELKKSPFVGLTNSGESIIGANYASAFDILALLGEESDVPIITEILQVSNDQNVIWSGCMAASTCLKNSVVSYPVLYQVFEDFIKNDSLSETIKTEITQALGENLTDEAEKFLEKTVLKASFPVNVYAAIRLGERNITKHRKLLEKLSSELPLNSLYPTSDLREMLEEE
jgi:hypothetical protein